MGHTSDRSIGAVTMAFLTFSDPGAPLLVAEFRTIQKPLVARFYSNSGYPTFVTFRHYRVYGVESWVRILADVS